VRVLLLCAAAPSAYLGDEVCPMDYSVCRRAAVTVTRWLQTSASRHNCYCNLYYSLSTLLLNPVAYHPPLYLITHNIKTQTTKFIKLVPGRLVCVSTLSSRRVGFDLCGIFGKQTSTKKLLCPTTSNLRSALC